MINNKKTLFLCTVLCTFLITQAAAVPSTATASAQSVNTQTLGAYIKKDITPDDGTYPVILERIKRYTWRAIRPNKHDNIFEIELEPPAEMKATATTPHVSNRPLTWSVNLLHNGKLAGFYEYTYSDASHPLPRITYLEVLSKWQGSGAVDILFEDFLERVLKGDRNARFKAHIVRAGTDSDEDIHTISTNKEKLRIRSKVTYKRDQIYKDYKIMPRKEAKIYMSEIRQLLPKTDRAISSDAYATGIFSLNNAKFIVRDEQRDAHFLVLEAIDHKSKESIKAEKLRYYLAREINKAWGRNLLSFTEFIDVPLNDIKGPQLVRWAKKNGLTHVTLIRVVTDYTTDTSLENKDSIEAQVPFYVMTRDYDHTFSAKNSFWIPSQLTNISYDHNAAFDIRLDPPEKYLSGDRTGPTPTRRCLFSQIFEGNYPISDDRLRALKDSFDEPQYRPLYPIYRLDLGKVKEYAEFMSDPKNLTDSLIKGSVRNAGYQGKDAEEKIAYLLKWRNDLVRDLENIISLTHHKPFSFDPTVAEEISYISA